MFNINKINVLPVYLKVKCTFMKLSEFNFKNVLSIYIQFDK